MYQPSEVRRRLACLTIYCSVRGDSGPVEHWTTQTEAEDRADLMSRLSLASVTTLGQIATIHSPRPPVEDNEDADDRFPWGDAARWSPSDDLEVSTDQAPGPARSSLTNCLVSRRTKRLATSAT